MLLMTCLSISCSLGWAGEAFHLDIKESRLDNGLEVLILEDHAVPLVTVQVWYRVGSRNERPGITGISHFLEHLMFKGTPKYGPGLYTQLIQRYGGTQNAFTSYDVTAYYSVLPSSRLELALDLEADRMAHLLLDPQEIKAEREVVKEERRLRENSPTGPMYEVLGALAYKAHPYQWPTIGWMSDIESITREELEAHYKTYYVPNNATVIVVGDVDIGQTMAAIRRHFEPIPQGPPPPPVRPLSHRNWVSTAPRSHGRRHLPLCPWPIISRPLIMPMRCLLKCWARFSARGKALDSIETWSTSAR